MKQILWNHSAVLAWKNHANFQNKESIFLESWKVWSFNNNAHINVTWNFYLFIQTVIFLILVI